MAKSNYNFTLEYATNTLEFWMYDDNDVEIPFESGVVFSVSRMDDPTKTYSAGGVSSGNHATFIVTPSKATLYKSGDDLYSYDEPVYEHIFSVRSPNNVYISGKLNLVQVG